MLRDGSATEGWAYNQKYKKHTLLLGIKSHSCDISLGMLRQEEYQKFEVSPAYTLNPCNIIWARDLSQNKNKLKIKN